jgi:hypothetical protein
MSVLRSPEASVGTGLATAGLVYAVYSLCLPPLVDVKVTESENRDLQSTERAATIISGSLVTGVALMTKDETVFVIGGVMVIAMAWLYRHADQVSPLTGKANAVISVPGMMQQDQPSQSPVFTDQSTGDDSII